MSYRDEFPDYDPETLPPIPADWVDVSWINNSAPSWSAGRVEVWIDYANPEDREFGQGYRFIVSNNPDADGAPDHNETLFETNDWDAILAFVAAHR